MDQQQEPTKFATEWTDAQGVTHSVTTTATRSDDLDDLEAKHRIIVQMVELVTKHADARKDFAAKVAKNLGVEPPASEPAA